MSVKGLAIACAMLVGTAAMAENLLFNPSFEEAGESATVAKGWNGWGDWLTREDSWSPTHSGKALMGYHHWKVPHESGVGLWQDAKVEAGRRYMFSIYANVDHPKDGNPPREVIVELEATIDGRQMLLARRIYPVEWLATGNDWSRLVVSAVAPADNLRVLVRMTAHPQAPRNGAVKLDDASLTSAPASDR